MKGKQILLAAVAAIVLGAAPMAAQLTSNPLEPGFYNYMQEFYRGVPSEYRPILVNDRTMLLGSSMETGGVMIDYTSSRQITLLAIVSRVRSVNAESKLATYSKVADHNFSSPVGTLYFDESSGLVTMRHYMNPSVVDRPAMGSVVTKFAEELREQRASFNRPVSAG